eukprot:sb/3470965/
MPLPLASLQIYHATSSSLSLSHSQFSLSFSLCLFLAVPAASLIVRMCAAFVMFSVLTFPRPFPRAAIESVHCHTGGAHALAGCPLLHKNAGDTVITTPYHVFMLCSNPPCTFVKKGGVRNTVINPHVFRCPLLHKNAGDTERKYHYRHYKTAVCPNETDPTTGHCLKNGTHCPFSHNATDLRSPVFGQAEIKV